MIRVQNLSKTYGKRIIFEKVNLVIPDNRITFIAGANGSGKTTLLKCFLNLERYDGVIRYADHPLENVRDDIFVVFDTSPLYSNLTGYQNIELLLSKEISKEEINSAALAFLNPEIMKSKVKTYSYGQKKKLSLLLALLHKPKYLFLDEVSNGLDYETILDLKNILQEFSLNMTIVAIGHQFEFYAHIIDELIILKNHSAIQLNDFKEGEGDLVETYKHYI